MAQYNFNITLEEIQIENAGCPVTVSLSVVYDEQEWGESLGGVPEYPASFEVIDAAWHTGTGVVQVPLTDEEREDMIFIHEEKIWNAIYEAVELENSTDEVERDNYEVARWEVFEKSY